MAAVVLLPEQVVPDRVNQAGHAYTGGRPRWGERLLWSVREPCLRRLAPPRISIPMPTTPHTDTIAKSSIRVSPVFGSSACKIQEIKTPKKNSRGRPEHCRGPPMRLAIRLGRRCSYHRADLEYPALPSDGSHACAHRARLPQRTRPQRPRFASQCVEKASEAQG